MNPPQKEESRMFRTGPYDFPRNLQASPFILVYWFEDPVYTLTYEESKTPYSHILKVPGVIKLVDYKRNAHSIHDAMNGDHTDAIWAGLVEQYIKDSEGKVFLGRNGRSYLRRGDSLKDLGNGLVQQWRSVDGCVNKCMDLVMYDFTPTAEKPTLTRTDKEELERKEFPQFADQLAEERNGIDVEKVKQMNMLYQCLDGCE